MKHIIGAIAKAIFRDYYYDLVYWLLIFRKFPAVRGNKPLIIIFNHFFAQDIEALKRANDSFELMVIEAVPFRYVGIDLFPKGVDSFSVFNDPALDDIKMRYKHICDRLIARIIHKYHPVAFVTPSDNFFYIRQIIRSFQDKHIPCIVSDKEGTICPAYFKHFARYIKETSPSISDYIFVWSPRQKLFWEHAGTPPEKIRVIGQPRSDFWKQPNRWMKRNQLDIPGLRQDSQVLLFFSYDPWSYTPEYMVKKGEMNWEQLRHQTDEVVYTFARQHPEIDVIIKVHPQQSDIDSVRESINSQNLSNLFLVTGVALSNQLIINADVVLGFQTTALIESMVTDKPIIYTYWGDAREKWSADLIPFHESPGVHVAQSPEKLLEMLNVTFKESTISPAARAARDEFVAEYLSIVDGRSAQRTFGEISRIIHNHAS